MSNDRVPVRLVARLRCHEEKYVVFRRGTLSQQVGSEENEAQDGPSLFLQETKKDPKNIYIVAHTPFFYN